MTLAIGSRAVVLGLGLTGLSLARYLHAARRATCASPTRADPPYRAAARGRRCRACARRPGRYADATFAGADLIAISPGRRRRTSRRFAAAVARGAELVGDIELFARALPPARRKCWRSPARTARRRSTVADRRADARAAGLRDRRRRQHRRRRSLDALAARERRDRGPACSCSSCRASSSRRRRASTPIAATVLNVTDESSRPLRRHRPTTRRRRRASSRGGGVQILNRDDPHRCG
mgnify:CR=1 FL=1